MRAQDAQGREQLSLGQQREVLDKLSRLQQQLAGAQAELQQRSQAQPKFEIQRELLERMAAQMQQMQAAERQAAQNPAPQISVDIAPERRVTVSIPFDSGTQGEAIATIASADGNTFNITMRNAITGPKWDIPLSLKPGAYRVQVVIRSTAGGTRPTKEFNFEVK